MRFPWANTVLLVLLAAQVTSGVGSLMSGYTGKAWVVWSHVAGAYAVTLVLLWKGRVIWRALRRRPGWDVPRLAFLLLLALLLATLITGFLWSYTGPHALYGFTLLTIHGFLAVATLLLLIWHLVARRVIFRVKRARDRRALLRLGGISLAGVLFWRMDRPVQRVLGLPGAGRRFTGSYETGSYSGEFPYVVWIADSPGRVDIDTWRLRVDGAVARPLDLDYDTVREMAKTELDALLDCTGGWYSTQSWRGVPVQRVLAMAGVHEEVHSLTVRAVTGYSRRFSLTEARNYVLATHVAGQPLDHGHGRPLRLVAPDKRGFEWIKWIDRIEVNWRSKYWQLPFPIQ